MAMSAPPGTIHGQTPTPSGKTTGHSVALCHSAGEVAVGQRQDIGQRNDIGGVAMVDHTVGAVGGRLADAVVHEVARKLQVGEGTGQTPDNAPAVALVVDLHNADAVDGIGTDIAEKTCRSRS